MVLEAVAIIGGMYLAMGLCLYAYSVVKTYEIVGSWMFGITKEYIGLCKYPRWTLFWLEMIVNNRLWRKIK